MRIGWAPDARRRASRIVALWARAGDTVLTLGAGDVDAAGRGCSRRSRDAESGVELSRYTTLGTGGPARAFAQPTTVAEVEELACGRGRRALGGGVGLGSNLLVADDGVDALVLDSAASSQRSRSTATLVRAGAGAANAVVLHRARERRARRLRVRVRDPRHDRRRSLDERRRLRRRLRDGARAGARRDCRRQRLAHAGRSSASRTGTRTCATARSSSQAELRLQPRDPDEIKADGARAQRAPQGGAADEPADVRQRLQEPRRTS